ncbi:MAG: type II secretion system GspH family protein [Deltaproteobacteria bacterium]|nr:type II secretion system GspH family protein [Deltaproteobacteria bacterium]
MDRERKILTAKKIIADNGAFTLIELVMVILLIGILAAVVLPKFVNLTGSANKAASQGIVGSLGEGVTTQMSKNLVNNDLSDYVAITGFSATKSGKVTFEPTLPTANAAGTNPYANPFLLLPNYSTPATGSPAGSGTSYNIVTTAPTVPSTTTPGNSWWLVYKNGTVAGPGTVAGLTAGLTCDNSATTNPNYVAPTTDVPVNEYTEQIGNIDYVYTNGSVEDSYAYYMVISANDNIEGFYMAPCQS